MRMAFGLVSLLIVLAICLLIFRTFEAPMLESGNAAQKQAQQLSGRDENGVPVMDSYKAQQHSTGSKIDGITITDLVPGGPMQTYYGLQKGDIVTDIGELSVTTLADPGGYSMAKSMLDEAYQKQQSLVVNRNGTKLTLPQQRGAGTAANGAAAPAPAGNNNALNNQLNQIRNIPTH